MKLNDLLKVANQSGDTEVYLDKKCVYRGKLFWKNINKKYLDCEVVYVGVDEDFLAEEYLVIRIK